MSATLPASTAARPLDALWRRGAVIWILALVVSGLAPTSATAVTYGSISGTITFPQEFWDAYPKEGTWGRASVYSLDGKLLPGSAAYWNSSGRFSFGGLTAGESYYLALDVDEFVESWVGPDGRMTDRSQRVAITAPSSGLQLSVDASRLKPYLRGKVTAPPGVTAQLNKIDVIAKPASASGRFSWQFRPWTSVRSDGTFTVTLDEDVPHHVRTDGVLAGGVVGTDGKANLSDLANAAQFSAGDFVNIQTEEAVSLRAKIQLAPGATFDDFEDIEVRGDDGWVYLETDSRTIAANDGNFEAVGLSTSGSYDIYAWGRYYQGYVRSDGEMGPDRDEAHGFTPPSEDVRVIVRPFVLSGRVELPEGVSYDMATPPLVTVAPRGHSPWTPPSVTVPVAPDLTFTTEGAGEKLDPTLSYDVEVAFPGRAPVYWQGDHAAATPDESLAQATRTRNDVFVPARNRAVALAAPSVSGTPRVGETLRTDGGSWTIPAPRLTFQWLRAGKPIPGATAGSYTVTSHDVGSRLAVRVTASANGWLTVSAVSAETSSVKATPRVTAKVLAKGTTKKNVRVRITVDAGANADAPGGTVRVTYGNTSRTVTLKAANRGSVVVKVKRAKPRGKLTVHYTPTGSSVDRLTAATGTVKVTKTSPKVKINAPKRAKRGAKVRTTIRVNTRGLTARPTGKIRLYVNGKPVTTVALKAKHKGRVTITLPRKITSDAKATLKIRARYTPAKEWKKYLKAKTTKTTKIRIR